jgi:hypothetical protein
MVWREASLQKHSRQSTPHRAHVKIYRRTSIKCWNVESESFLCAPCATVECTTIKESESEFNPQWHSESSIHGYRNDGLCSCFTFTAVLILHFVLESSVYLCLSFVEHCSNAKVPVRLCISHMHTEPASLFSFEKIFIFC